MSIGSFLFIAAIASTRRSPISICRTSGTLTSASPGKSRTVSLKFPLRDSPDGRWVAFSAPDNLLRYSMANQRVYLRAVTEAQERVERLEKHKQREEVR